MTKKKTYRPHHRPARLSSFARALRDATLRLDKAIQERTDCMQKLTALGNEIPFLEHIVRALTPPDVVDDLLDKQIAIRELEHASARIQSSAPPPPNVVPQPDLLGSETLDPVDQAQFLARFMPRPGRTTALHPGPGPLPGPAPLPTTGTSDDPDEFLNDDGPGLPILD